jgi:hypothetical protein
MADKFCIIIGDAMVKKGFKTNRFVGLLRKNKVFYDKEFCETNKIDSDYLNKKYVG